jgi:oligopeptide transport system substrate-binding protein
MTKNIIVTVLSVFGVVLGALSAPAIASAPANARTFTLRLQNEPATLDWNRAHTMVETYLLMNLMEGLVTFDENLKVIPALAKSWTKSPDGRVYTFKLRSDVKWSDGVLLKAQDFVFSWRRLLSPLTAASYAYFLFDVEGAEDFSKGKIKDFSAVGIKALDDFTLQVKLLRPVAHWIYVPTFWVTFPLRQDIVEKFGESWTKPGRMVTVGPFTQYIHDIDSKIVLKRNPLYYEKRGNIEEVVALIVKDDSTALTLYESGKFDFLTDISAMDLKRLSSNQELKAFPYFKTGYMGFSINKFPVSNSKVRRAIAMAIDKKKIREILHGGQLAADSFIPPKMLAYAEGAGLPFDPVKAKAELQSAGLSGSLDLDLVVPNSDRALTIAQFIQAQLKSNLGINVSINTFDHKTFRAQLDLHVFPIFLLSWSADFPDPDNFLSLFLGGAGNNRTTWTNQAYDAGVLKARNMSDPKQRKKVYVEVQKILLQDDAVIVPLYYEPNMALVRSRVKGLELNPLNYLLLRKVNIGQ